MKKQNVRTISLIVCTFTYLLVGAAVFDALESETERKRWEALQAIENMIIEKYDISEEDFKVMETVVLKTEPHKAGQQWKFTGAFYYATTVLTTIGYGHSTPSTVGGKLFTMFYAIVGIPLGLVMFQSIGERVNRLSSFVIRTVKKSLHCRVTAASELDLICVVTTLSSLTIAGGAAAFSKFENWSYFDSVYYCFITLTTIGFGDMVALQKDNALNTKPEYVMFSLIFILFGLAIVAASLNLLVLRFVTMNTEDERRDEAQAMQALQVAVRLEGDVITANGSILSGHLGHRIDHNLSNSNFFHQQIQASLDGDNTSICSCHCACFSATRKRRHRYHMRRSPPQAIRTVRTFAQGPDDGQINFQKDRLKAISMSTSSLPPIYSVKDFAERLAIKPIEDHLDLYGDDFEDLDDLYNLYHQTNDLLSIANAPDLEIAGMTGLTGNDAIGGSQDLDLSYSQYDFELDEDRQQMTTTTTIASLKQHQRHLQHITTITSTLTTDQHGISSDLSPLYQPLHRASL